MNVQRDPDAVLAAWLEEGPYRLPEQTRRAISFTTRTTQQKRRSPWAPWRTPLMPTFARIALATVAVIAMVGGAAYFIGSQQRAGGPSPSSSPTVSAAPSSAATLSIDWTTYTSSRFAYAIDHPTAWRVIPAILDWPGIDFPDKDGYAHDVFAPVTAAARVFVSSVPLKAGKAAADWVSELDTWNADHSCQMSAARTITIDGVSARRQEGVCMSGTDHLDEVVMADGQRFYQINLFNATGTFTDADRATFERFLASFRFGG